MSTIEEGCRGLINAHLMQKTQAKRKNLIVTHPLLVGLFLLEEILG